MKIDWTAISSIATLLGAIANFIVALYTYKAAHAARLSAKVSEQALMNEIEKHKPIIRINRISSLRKDLKLTFDIKKPKEIYGANVEVYIDLSTVENEYKKYIEDNHLISAKSRLKQTDDFIISNNEGYNKLKVIYDSVGNDSVLVPIIIEFSFKDSMDNYYSSYTKINIEIKFMHNILIIKFDSQRLKF
ncbi:hypothetical protein [Macrococcus armenti]|uniref:hypothetical protein n=1 Tax=Macrococcus armenti TaxID=2875764 RepID=UPI001CD69B08|nr:hypothetical protein [Macrococcus armenti]UBH10606.1 hypothetical protein LAU38_10265 [Macrococcus armenti]